MSQKTIPQELAQFITAADWGRTGIIGHKSTIIEYPENTLRLLRKKVFSFEDLTQFEWQELQSLLINIDAVEELVSLGFPAKKFHLYDAPQLIEVLHHPKPFNLILHQDVSAEELAKFSGYQLKLVLTHPESMAAILKNFEGVDDLLKLKWNWIEEMLLRPEDALALLVYGVKWDQIDHLQAWDFGWFLKHRHEIMKLLEQGIDFNIIANLDVERLRLTPALAPILASKITDKDLQRLDFWQLFMVLSHLEVVVDFMKKGFPKEDWFHLDSMILEKLLEDPRGTQIGYECDPRLFKQLRGMKPIKVEILLVYIEHYEMLVKGGVHLDDLKSLLDDQFRLVLESPEEYIPLVELANRYNRPIERPLSLDRNFTAIMNLNRDKLEKLLASGLTFEDLTRFPLIFPAVLQFADNIISLFERGVPTEEIFHLTTDQIQYAFSRFPLLEILPDLDLSVKDIQPYMIGEFKVILSHLKAFSMLKRGGADMRILSQITMPHLGVILKYPEYVLSLTQKGVPLYKFDLLDSHKLTIMLQNPLTPEAQQLIQELMQK